MDFCPYRANIVCILTQGVALGYGLLPLQGELEAPFWPATLAGRTTTSDTQSV